MASEISVLPAGPFVIFARVSDVTRILDRISEGDPTAAEQLLPLVYEELRKLAAAKMAQEPPGQTLQATALVHEAWLRLIGGGSQSWNGRGHFFGAAAEAMRRILVEVARRKSRLRYGGGAERNFELLHAYRKHTYVLQDYFHSTAVMDTTALVQERYGYDGFGAPRYMDGRTEASGAALRAAMAGKPSLGRIDMTWKAACTRSATVTSIPISDGGYPETRSGMEMRLR